MRRRTVAAVVAIALAGIALNASRERFDGTTIGHKRIVRCGPLTASRVRVNVVKARACPTLATVGVY